MKDIWIENMKSDEGDYVSNAGNRTNKNTAIDKSFFGTIMCIVNNVGVKRR